VQWEIAWTTKCIESITGVHPRWFRPPGGNFGQAVYAYAEQSGMRSALWTVDPQDWRTKATPEEIAASVVGAAHPNAIILLHDGGGDQSGTIAALPAIIDGLRAAGYRFVTLDELPEVRSGW
jgi:peptidoglycan/xylan/chitin deacetylase (PgdA/CDA1 family)